MRNPIFVLWSQFLSSDFYSSLSYTEATLVQDNLLLPDSTLQPTVPGPPIHRSPGATTISQTLGATQINQILGSSPTHQAIVMTPLHQPLDPTVVHTPLTTSTVHNTCHFPPYLPYLSVQVILYKQTLLWCKKACLIALVGNEIHCFISSIIPQ